VWLDEGPFRVVCPLHRIGQHGSEGDWLCVGSDGVR
jgi:hypothetical protein